MGGERSFERSKDDDVERIHSVPTPPAAVYQVGPVDDRYEREAEQTAQRVMRALAEGGETGVTLRRDPASRQQAAAIGEAGGEIGADTAALISRARGGGAALPREIRAPMERAFGGADFGAVRIHTGEVPEILNERVSARAFTVGNDIFLGRQVPALDSADGGHILAHELAHTRQQSGGARRCAGPFEVQRLFQPVATTKKTTLRTGPDGGDDRQGRAIPEGTEIVADRTQQAVEHRTVFADEVWTLAADVRPENWNAALTPDSTYVRTSKLGPDKVYPIRDRSVQVPGRYVTPERRWNDRVGEYVYIEDSPRGGGAEIVQKQGLQGVRTLIPPGTLVPSNQQEKHHVDVAQLQAELINRLTTILRNAAIAQHLDPNLFAKPEHVFKPPLGGKDLMKPLRMSEISGLNSEEFARWYAWKENVITKITTGAAEAAASIEFWRQSLHPQQNQVRVTDIEIDASDLHDRGLGAIIVEFSKPLGPNGSMFADKTQFKTAVKPEDRSIEASVFGTAAGSLASRMDRLAGLDPNERIAKIKMQTHALHGSLIEFVAGTLARQLNGQQAQMSPAAREAMVLAYVAGLSDVHQDNVIWVGDRPYFIDADNALNASRIALTAKPGFENQTGFTKYSDVDARAEQTTIKTNPAGSASKIMQALLDAGNPIPVVDAVRKTFTGRTGRVVPLFTNTWADCFKAVIGTPYFAKPKGTRRDAPSLYTTQWALVAQLVEWLPRGSPGKPEPGLEGESGIAAAGLVYDQATAARQIKADLEQGKIPFFTYEYDTGHVSINGRVIWHGAPLAESLEVLLARFPHQRNIVDIP